MTITIEVDVKEVCKAVSYDCRKIRIVGDELVGMVNRITNAFNLLNQVKEEVDNKPGKPEKKVAPVQPEEPKKAKRKWTAKQQSDIDAIKKAVADKKEEDGRKKKGSRLRTDIDNDTIVRMYEEEGKSFTQIAKELRCSQQTASNRYNKAKGID